MRLPFRILAFIVHLGAVFAFAKLNDVAVPFTAAGLPFLLLVITGTYTAGLYGGLALTVVSTVLLADANPLIPAAGIAAGSVLRLVVFSAVVVLTHLLVRRTAELRQKSEELRREIRIRNEYTAMVAHELRNPLIAIRAAATTWAKHPDPVRLADGIRDEAAAAMALLDGLNEVAGIESGRLRSVMQPIDLANAVRVATEIQDGEPRLRIAGLDQTLPVMGDRDRLAQVVKNLVSNAMKYSPPGTPVLLDAGISADRRTAIVSVRDYGMGVPPAERGNLFRKFKRLSTAGATRGSGLGLYISQEIVRDHGGTLDAEWPAEGGTRFFFTLPLLAA